MTRLFGYTETSPLGFLERIYLTLSVKSEPDRVKWNKKIFFTEIFFLTLTISLIFIDSLSAKIIL